MNTYRVDLLPPLLLNLFSKRRLKHDREWSNFVKQLNGKKPVSKIFKSGKTDSTSVYSEEMNCSNMQVNKDLGKGYFMNATNTVDSIITPVMNYTEQIRAFVEQDYGTKKGIESNKTENLPEAKNKEENSMADGEKSHTMGTNASSGNTDSRDEKLASVWSEGQVSEKGSFTKELFPPYHSLLDANAERNNLKEHNGNGHCELEGSQNRNNTLRGLKTPGVTPAFETEVKDANHANSNEEKDMSSEQQSKITEVGVIPSWKSDSVTAESELGAQTQKGELVSPDHLVLQPKNENIDTNCLKPINIELLPLGDPSASDGSQFRKTVEQAPENQTQLNNASATFCSPEAQPHNPVLTTERLSEKASKMENMCIEEKNAEQFVSSGVSVEDMDPDTVCGIGCFKPVWLQKWATSTTYLVIFSIIGVIQASYYSYLLGTISTIEKRYAFKSKISGVIMLADEITPVLLGVLVGYFGGKSHRPRMVAIGMYLSALCCFFSALPYFLYGPDPRLMASITSNFTRSAHCESNIQAAECDEDDRPPTMVAVVCFVIGSFLKGFGNLAYYAIGIAYMDDTGKKKNMPIYLAITGTLRILGPALGFVMASAFLKFYEDPTVDPGFGPEDARWVGGWWIGFVIQGTLLFAFTFPILLFPRRLPKQRLRAFSNTQNFYQETVRERIAGMFGAIKRLIRNPIYIWFTAGTILAIIGGFGYMIMLPKYVQIQFRVTASESSLLAGPPALGAMLVAIMAGGLIVWKWKPGPRQLMAAIMGTEAVAIICYLVLMVYSCGNYRLSGTSLMNGELQLHNECNSGCNCTTSVFMPVCGPDGISTYFSPCHAACATSNFVDGTQRFYNCSCVHDEDENFILAESVDNGPCYDVGCWAKAIGFVATWVCFSLVINSMRAGHTVLLLRSVEPRDKSVALGMFETFTCAFGFIPNPVIYGALVDSACLVWESSCGTTGNCWVYDIDHLRHLLHGAAAAFACASFLCYAVVFCLAGRVRDLYEEEDTEEQS